MKNILNFLIKIGKLKDVQRKGITFYGVKNPDSATDHAFRMAIMAWFLGKKKNIHMEKILKMALIHDICKIYTGDITPYNGLLPKNKKERQKFVKRWRRLLLNKKKKKYIEKFNREYSALKKLTLNLPAKFKKEMIDLWFDYHKMKSAEARLVHQIDVTENLIEALECWRKNKKFPTEPWWEHAEEVIDDPALFKLLKEIEKKELRR